MWQSPLTLLIVSDKRVGLACGSEEGEPDASQSRIPGIIAY